MEKTFDKAIAAFTALFFGTILAEKFATAVWPAVSQLLQYAFWLVVALAGAVGMWALGYALRSELRKERLERRAEEERQRAEEERWMLARRQREELEALHNQVRNAYHDLFDAERRRLHQLTGR